MPSAEHEHLVELFRNRPALAAELLRASGGPPLPAFGEARLASSDQTEVPPATRLADAVVQLRDGDGTVAAIVVEVQLARKERKRYTWPLYVASVRAELRCETLLLVLAPRRAVARWAARPIAMGHPDWVLRPIVVGPEGVPVVTDPAWAEASPELAVLSALAHGAGEQGYEVARAVLFGLGRVDEERAWVYSSIVLPALGEAVRARLEEEMKLENLPEPPEFLKRARAQGQAEGREEGRAEARAQDLLTVLSARGLSVSGDVRARILACRDANQLSEWLVRAVRVERAEDLFDDV